jgi:predicted TIM-barrel fold metal-dependent hydrolase
MIVDVLTRIWHSPDQLGMELSDAVRRGGAPGGSSTQLDGTIAAHARETACETVTLVHGFRSNMLGALVPNEFVADHVRRHPDRMLGIAGIDPLASEALDELERARALGLVGVSISPSAQGFHAANSSAMRLYERCEALGLPVFAARLGRSTASCIMEFDRPAAFDEVMRSFPRLKLVLGEIGFPWVDEALVLMSKHAGVFADTSGMVSRPWQLYGVLLSASSLGVIDRIMLGSGFPFERPASAVETILSLNSYALGTPLPAIPRASLRGIVERDAVSALGLAAVLGPGSSVRGAVRSSSPLGPTGLPPRTARPQ